MAPGRAWFVANGVDFGFTLLGVGSPLASAVLACDELDTDEIEWSNVIVDFGDGVICFPLPPKANIPISGRSESRPNRQA